MLDLLPEKLWTNKKSRFLDPGCKSGIFLREIAKRLDKGLESQIPDRQQRIDHIMKNQLFGLAITDLTAQISRRSLYCSKKANGQYSISSAFRKAEGNISYESLEHTWKNGRCIYCGASEGNYSRGDELESHAYRFIHTEKPEELFKMKFDVIIGNPPYQLSDGGFGRSATPIYNEFVLQAIKLNPRYLVMIIPARWFGGGKGLDGFRSIMLNDKRIRVLVDYENASEVFPGIDLAGGVCYFLWDRDNPGLCNVINIHSGEQVDSMRELSEFHTLIRHGQSVSIIRKVLDQKETKMSDQVSSRKPFGLSTIVRPKDHGDIILRWNEGEGPYPRELITVGSDLIDKWKVVTAYVGYDHAGNPGKDGKRRVFSKIDILPPGTICTETYLVIGAYDSLIESENLVAYMKTKFFRFLVSQFMYSHHITKDAYSFVPVLDMNTKWTDSMLQEKYKISETESTFIESKIKDMA